MLNITSIQEYLDRIIFYETKDYMLVENKENTSTGIKKRILIVDDETLILSQLSNALRIFCDFQGEVKTVKSGREAVREISHCFCDICFLDINLPDLNGLEVMKKINELSPVTKIAIMTASLINNDMMKTIKDGASLLIEKPFDLSRIKTFVKQVLG